MPPSPSSPRPWPRAPLGRRVAALAVGAPLALLPAARAEDAVARAGRDFLAYPGETVVLDGTASSPAGIADWRWVQIGGPSTSVEGANTPHPRFVVKEPGRYTFELSVRTDELPSAPDTVDVIVLEPDAGARFADSGGCAHAAAGAPALLLGLLGAAALRPRRGR
jgi:hypothetical protein